MALGGRRSRMLVAVLVLRPNESVRRDALIEAIWGDAPPGSASHALDNLVSRVRAELGAEVLQSRPGGYALVVDPECVDASRFEALAARGRAALASGELERAAALLHEALELWRGEPLADLADEPGLADEIRRLWTRARSWSRIVWTPISRLGGIGSWCPSWEAGRRGAAARASSSAADAGAVSLGPAGRRVTRVSRGAGLSRRRAGPGAGSGAARAGAGGDESRPCAGAAAVAPPPVAGQRGPARRRGPPRPRLIGALAGLLVVTAVAGVVALVAAGGPSRPAALTLPDGGVVVVGKDDVRSVASDVGLSGLASLGRVVWASSYASGRLLRVDPARQAVTQTVAVGQGPGSVVAASGDLWVVDAARGRVVRVDGASGQVVQRVDVGESPVAVAAGFGSVWVAVAGEQSVARLDPQSGRVTARVGVGATPAALSAGAGGVWVAQPEARRVVRIEPRRGQVDVTVSVGAGPQAVSATGDAVWVANVLDATVSRVDPTLGRVVATASVGGAPVALAADDEGVWVAVRGKAALLRLAGRSGRPERTVAVGGPPVALARTDDGVAVAVSPAASEHRGGTLRVLAFGPTASLDPGACCVIPPEIPAVLYDGLTGFDRLGSSAPSLVADLAVALPSPTAEGRVYTFTLRPGLRYSTGARVRASDFRRAAERVVRSRNEGSRDVRSSRWRRTVRQTAGRSVRPAQQRRRRRRRRHRVVPPLPPGSRVPLQARPSTWPPLSRRAHPSRRGRPRLPGTGPYRARRFTPSREVVLERNPYFRESSPAAQPAGRPDRIVFSLGANSDSAVAALMRGEADVMLGGASPAALARLRTEHPGQLHLHTVPSLDWVGSTRAAAPFDDLRVRRALALAVDRDAAVDVFGGPGTARATCQVLPPGTSGYVRYCPYTRRPDRSGPLAGARPRARAATRRRHAQPRHARHLLDVQRVASRTARARHDARTATARLPDAAALPQRRASAAAAARPGAGGRRRRRPRSSRRERSSSPRFCPAAAGDRAGRVTCRTRARSATAG